MTDERQSGRAPPGGTARAAHAEVLRGRVDVEPARLDGRTCSRDGFALFLATSTGGMTSLGSMATSRS